MKLGYIIIYVPDVMHTIVFYEHAFGLVRRFVHEGNDYGELDTGQTTLAFASETLRDGNATKTQNNRLSEEPAGAEIAFVTPDVSSAYTKAIACGATAYHAPAQKPWGQTVAYVRDNNGFLVEICSPMG